MNREHEPRPPSNQERTAGANPAPERGGINRPLRRPPRGAKDVLREAYTIWDHGPVPRERAARIAELIALYHLHVHLPLLDRTLPEQEEAALRDWASGLSDRQLGEEIRRRRRQLDRDLDGQLPPDLGLAKP